MIENYTEFKNMNIKILNQIKKLIEDKSLEPIELERLEQDLFMAHERLSKGQYKIRDFSGKNKFDVPQRTKEFFDYLESYCLSGKTLAKIFNEIPSISKFKTIADLCSGWAPKVTLAFYYLRYKGELTLLDKRTDFMFQLKNFMKLFQPDYSIKIKKIDLFKNSSKKYELVVGNHIIDDLILDYFYRNNSVNTSTFYKNENELMEAWQKILKAKQQLEKKIVPIFVNIFKQIVNRNGYLFLSQYKGMVEGLLNLNEAVEFNQYIMQCIEKSLLENGFISCNMIPKKALTHFQGSFTSNECFLLKNIN